MVEEATTLRIIIRQAVFMSSHWHKFKRLYVHLFSIWQ